MMRCLRAAVALAALTATYDAHAAARQPNVSRTARDDTVATMLRDASRTGTLSGLKWPKFPHYRDELTSLYSGANWQPLWTQDGRPSAGAREAIDALKTADERGLHPADYDAALLERRYGDLEHGSSSAREIAWFDLAVSIGLLRHLSDVHIGRVNPKNLSIGINVEPKKLDLARVVRDHIDRGRVSDLVREVEPRFVQYRNLKAAYAHYLKLADSTLPVVKAARPIKPGDHFSGVMALRRRLAAFGDLPPASRDTRGRDTTVYDAATAEGVANFQSRHGLPMDSVLGPGTAAALNVSPARRLRQLELALERIRWLPELGTGPFVVVNVPSFQVYGFDSLGTTGTPDLTMSVVVGKADVGRRTPIFERDMQYIVFRPYWVIPPGILVKETLPAIRRDPSYLTRNDMEIYDGPGDTGTPVKTTPNTIAAVRRGEFGIRRRPGPNNDLGLAKFIFPNDHNVYMHGTPATALFSRARRDFSHGCIRLEDPARFAVWVLRDPTTWSLQQVVAAMNGTRSQRVNLRRPMPVVIAYTTAVVRPDGVAEFYDDIYGHDAKLEKALAKGYPYQP